MLVCTPYSLFKYKMNKNVIGCEKKMLLLDLWIKKKVAHYLYSEK